MVTMVLVEAELVSRESCRVELEVLFRPQSRYRSYPPLLRLPKNLPVQASSFAEHLSSARAAVAIGTTAML